MIPGVAFEEFQNALVDAFDQDALAQMFRTRLNERLDAVVGGGNTRKIVFELITWAEQRGLEAELARAAYLERPRNEKVRSIYQKFGLAPAVSVQEHGLAIADAATSITESALQKTVKPLIPSLDMEEWRARSAMIEGQVCRIEFNGNAAGTGFLVAADAVLTNFHVMQSVIDDRTPPAAVACRFDYRHLVDGSRREGTTVGLAAPGWLVDSSPPSKAERENQLDRELPRADELDYALVRLHRPFGSEPIGAAPGSGAPPRGWILVPDNSPESDLAPRTPLIIVQHPDGKPQKVTIDTSAVIGVNANGTRVRYATNTENGSSGSPCFTMDWRLAALHNCGDPASIAPEFNQGIPIARIRRMLQDRGKAYALGKAQL